MRRVLFSSFLGSAVEFYDFLLYGTAAALVFGQLFFSDLTPVVATIASFATLAVGYIVRPLGGVDLRPLRRPDRPQIHARADHEHHGRGQLRDRPAAHLRRPSASSPRSC